MKHSFKKSFCEIITVSAFLMVLPMGVFGEMGIGEQILSVGPRATYSTPTDADSGEWFTGAQSRLNLSNGLGLEASIDYRRNDFSSFTIIETYPVQVSLISYLKPGDRWSPYILGGGGWYYTQVTGPFSYTHSDFRFGVHAGAGLEIMLNQGVSVDTTYRYVWLEGVTSIDANALNKTYQDSGSIITIAINLLF